MIVIEKQYRILGFTENVTTCSCCGREDLKGTLALENNESGEIQYFGVVCGAKIAGNTKKYIEAELKEVEKQNLVKAREEFSNSRERIEYDEYIQSRPADFLSCKPEYADIAKRSEELFNQWHAKRSQVALKYFIKYPYRVR